MVNVHTHLAVAFLPDAYSASASVPILVLSTQYPELFIGGRVSAKNQNYRTQHLVNGQ